jgi:hypothetical protein
MPEQVPAWHNASGKGRSIRLGGTSWHGTRSFWHGTASGMAGDGVAERGHVQRDRTATTDRRVEDASPEPNIDGALAFTRSDAGVRYHSRFGAARSTTPFMRFPLECVKRVCGIAPPPLAVDGSRNASKYEVERNQWARPSSEKDACKTRPVTGCPQCPILNLQGGCVHEDGSSRTIHRSTGHSPRCHCPMVSARFAWLSPA